MGFHVRAIYSVVGNRLPFFRNHKDRQNGIERNVPESRLLAAFSLGSLVFEVDRFILKKVIPPRNWAK